MGKNKQQKETPQKNYEIGDEVSFQCEDTIKKGVVFIVDENGTFERPNILSYDIMVDNENTLYKHVTCDLVL